MRRLENLEYVALLVILTAVYFFSAKLGLTLAFVHVSATAVWPPTGIAIASFLLFGPRIWPGILLGAFLANLTTAGTVFTSFSIAVGNTLEGFLGAYLVNRYARGTKVFERPNDVFKFIILAAMISPTVSATAGVTSLSLAQFAQWADYTSIWLTWWLGDLVGALLVTPVLVLWKENSSLKWNGSKLLETFFLFSSLIFVSVVIFGEFFHPKIHDYPLTFLCIPPIIWAVLRFSSREVASTVVILAGIAIWFTSHGSGPFVVGGSPHESLLFLQLFMGVIAIMAISASAAVSETKRTKREIQIANEELEKANQMKSTLISLVSHELRTPLTSITAGIDVLLEGIDGPMNPAQTETLGIAKNNIDRLARLISNILDYTTLEDGKMEMHFQKTNFNVLLMEVYDLMKHAVLRKSIKFLIYLPEKPLIAFCDADRMKEVAINLIDNAMKYTDKGGNITLRLQSNEAAIEMEVEDTGIGINKEDQEAIFEMFRQGSPRGAKKIGGFGVGLAVCRLIVNQHNGHISVKSFPGKGSRFIISLPSDVMNSSR